MARGDSTLKRRTATREQKRRFIIYCEGKKTEPADFDALWRSLRSALVELEILHTGMPMTIAAKAVARAKDLKRSRNSFDKEAQVWAVFDRDEHPNYDRAVDVCECGGVGVGRSNPCFEIWLILHEQDYDRPDDRHDVCAHLRNLRPEYDPKGAKTCDCGEMILRVEHAETRATTLLNRRASESSPYGRPSTTIGELTKAIREAAAESSKLK